MPRKADILNAVSHSGKRGSITKQDNLQVAKNVFSFSISGKGMNLFAPSAATVILTPRMKRLGGYDSYGGKPNVVAEQHQLEARATVFLAAEANNLKGLQMYEAGYYVDAIGYFSRAIYLIPREMSYIFHRAEAYFQLGDIKAAIDNYRRACQFTKDPKFMATRLSYALFINGLRLMDQGKMKQALLEFDRAWRLNKSSHQLILAAAVCHLSLENVNESFKLLDMVTATHPDDADLYVLRSKIYHHLEDIAQVHLNLEVVRRVSPRHAEIPVLQRVVNDIVVDYRNKAFELVRTGEVRKAICCLTKAIHILKDNTLLLQRGMLFHQIKDYENSINDLQPIVDKEGMKEVTREVLMKLSNSFFNLAIGHRRDYQLVHAIDQLTWCLQYDPGNFMAYFERGDCYQLVGQDMMAFRDFEKCLSLRENHAESRLRFSQVSFRIANDLMAKKKYRAALDYYTISIQYKRDIMLPFFMRAQCYLLLGNAPDATDDIMECLKLEPGNTRCQLFLLDNICKGDQSTLLKIVDAYEIRPFPLDNQRFKELRTSTSKIHSNMGSVNVSGLVYFHNDNNNNGDDNENSSSMYQPLVVHVPTYHNRYYPASSLATVHSARTQNSSRSTRSNLSKSPVKSLNSTSPVKEMFLSASPTRLVEELSDSDSMRKSIAFKKSDSPVSKKSNSPMLKFQTHGSPSPRNHESASAEASDNLVAAIMNKISTKKSQSPTLVAASETSPFSAASPHQSVLMVDGDDSDGSAWLTEDEEEME